MRPARRSLLLALVALVVPGVVPAATRAGAAGEAGALY